MTNILNFIKKYKLDLIYFVVAVVVLTIIKFLFNLLLIPIIAAVIVYFIFVNNTGFKNLFTTIKNKLKLFSNL